MKKYELLINWAKQIQPNIVIEIGTMPWKLTDPLAECYGLSTWKLGEYLKEVNCPFVSVDIDENHLNNSKAICNEAGIYPSFFCCDGTQFLKEWRSGKIDMLYLDNGDKKVTFEQFKLAESLMSDKGVIILDDCHCDEQGGFSKATLVIPYAIKNGYTAYNYPVDGNCIMMVLRKEKI